MRKYLLMMAMPFVALSAFASGESSLNAICVQLKTGDCKYVAFTDQPKIESKGTQIHVVSLADDKDLALASMDEVDKIMAVNHDFSTDGIKSVVVDGKQEEIYNIDGTRATSIVPGKVYIIKSNGKTRKVVK